MKSFTRHTRMRTAILAGALTSTLGLAACSSGSDDGGQETRTLRAGVIYTPTVPIVECGLKPLADNKDLKDVGIKIQTTDSGQLGAENELLEQASSGELDIALAAGSTLSTVFGIPELSMFETYYLYDTPEDIARVRETDVANEAFGKLADEANLEAVGTPWLYGERHVFGNKALRTPEDFKGLKLRVPETEVSVASARALGASPTPTAYSELYLGLQQGIVDAAEAPLSTIKAESFHEPSDYINLTGHLISAASPLVNSDTWKGLSDEQRDAIEKAFTAAADDIAACVEKADAAALEEWKESGDPKIVDDVDRDALRKLAEDAYSSGFEWSDSYVKLLDELKG